MSRDRDVTRFHARREKWKSLPREVRIRRIAKRDFGYIFLQTAPGPGFKQPYRIPRGKLLDHWAATFGTEEFDEEFWHRYANRLPVPNREEQKLTRIAQEHSISKQLVREIQRALRE